MIATDEDALICDMAEVYQITEMRELPARTLAVLAFGLPAESRSKTALAGVQLPPKTLLLALIADKLATLVWFNSEDGRKKRNRPASIVEAITKARAKETNDIQTFASGADFQAAWDRESGG